MSDRYLYAGLVRLHILHHATREKIYGLAMMEELARHGYKMSAGTLYPILHGMEERGLLTAEDVTAGQSRRRVYQATPAGHKALEVAKRKVQELFSELFENEAAAPAGTRVAAPQRKRANWKT